MATRITQKALEATARDLSELTGNTYSIKPSNGSNGMWILYYQTSPETEMVMVTERRTTEMASFMDAYRRGFGRCLDQHAIKQFHRFPAEQKAELAGLARELEELAANRQELQFEVDDLIFDQCGTGEHWSAVNNAGIEAQLEALAEECGIEVALTSAKSLLEKFRIGSPPSE